jgi:hypothetical protein
MYAKDTLRINHPSEGVTSSFKCQQGVKQGCPFSPLLFRLYLDAWRVMVFNFADPCQKFVFEGDVIKRV